MLPGNAIEVKNISKKFKVYYDKGNTLKEKVLFKKRRTYENRVVLEDISFQVKKGEAIGLIGHNGCGKSTTLKLLTRIMYPDSGSIEINGRVSSLIELGAGFHPDMTGRENIYINAAIFGLTRKEIDKRLQEIIDFSELHEFIDNPVRTYSSGMYMRLAFSVAINVDAEVLLIDEILGVGDANFQVKCFNKLREIKENGTTIVIVSHALGQIEEICERSLWIHEGKIREEGEPSVVHAHYLNFMKGIREVDITSKNIKINKVAMWNQAGRVSKVFLAHENKKIQIDLAYSEGIQNCAVKIEVLNKNTLQKYCNRIIENKESIIDYQKNSIYINFPEFELITGTYSLSIGIENKEGITLDYCQNAYEFDVYILNK